MGNQEIKAYLPNPNKLILHERDIEYFQEYPAPIMENFQRMHFTNINSTIPYFGPILYFLVRQFGCEKILEIGHAEGYSSFYLAHGVKDNGIRFGMLDNRYYGIDIVQTESVREKLEAEGLPVTIINKDSMTLDNNTFSGIIFDMIFQDGCHDAEHVVYEFNTMWGQLKNKGDGYWIAHDAEGPAWEGCNKIKQLLKERNEPHEIITLGGSYGLMIIRKMNGFDYNNNPWRD
jgi:predicted O-methyltransferase YrrM